MDDKEWRDTWEFERQYLSESLTWRNDQSRMGNWMRIIATLGVYGFLILIILWSILSLLP